MVTLEELQRSTAISRALQKTGFYGRVARKQPLLKESNKKSRCSLPEAMQNTANMWKKVLWSDETKIELFQKFHVKEEGTVKVQT